MTKQEAKSEIENIFQGILSNYSQKALLVAMDALDESIELEDIRNIISNAQNEKYERLEKLINED